ncbi:hypothetical protein CDD83_9941 [Cordyceps sp. RAO-2017]|nr:hypothetical protein CDD83_9941 [Cordyceps sp. RAO-2017]
MSAAGPTKTELVHAYRHLLRGAMRAVQFAVPARFTARDQLRAAFRGGDAAAYDAERVKRTLWFLGAAARQSGLEHRLLKNLLLVRGLRERRARHWKRALLESRLPRTKIDDELDTATRHYDMTVAMLNETMGLCLS